jgi:hypothetical protein
VRLQGQQASVDSASIVQLRPDRFVRIEAPELGRVSGRVQSLTGAALVLERDAGQRTVSLAAIDTIWVRARRTKTGAIVGGILGAVGGAFLGALADGLCEYDCGGNSVLPGAVLGAGAGAITGGLIGAAIPRWRRIFPH